MKLNLPRVLILTVAYMASAIGGHCAHAADEVRETRGFFQDREHVVNLDFEFAEVQVIRDLPPGNYIANAVAVVASSDPQFHNVQCIFTIGGSIQGIAVQSNLGGGINNFVSIPLTIGFTLNSHKRFAVACRTDVANIVVSQPSLISVVNVDRIRGAIVIP
jgi:hypothetical protein